MHHGAIGEPCNARVACVSGASCADSVCVATAPVGAACSNAAPCGPDAGCIGRCADGTECFGGGTCADGASCSRTECVAWGVAGARCDGFHLCAEGVCQLDVCSIGAGLGEICTDLYCADGLFCSASGTCVGPVGRGEACVRSDQCPAGYGCDGVCFAWHRLGESCSPGTLDRCVSGTGCVGGTCRVLPSLGEPCTDGCLSGVCTSGVCADAPIGTPCRLGDRLCGALVCPSGRNACEPTPVTCEALDACPYEQFCAESAACEALCYVGR
jgi:hypothetical protein